MPFHDILRLQTLGGTASSSTFFTLIDLNGREVGRQILAPEQAETALQTISLPSGIYLLKAVNDEQSWMTPVANNKLYILAAWYMPNSNGMYHAFGLHNLAPVP